MPQKVLVTGHNGYIGSVMVPVLQAQGHQVAGLDTDYFADSAFGVHDSRLTTHDSRLKKDIRDVTLNDLVGFDAVIHLAALCNDPLGDLNPAWTAEINYAASVALATLAKEAGVRRFLYSSSCSMYGAAGDALLTEQAPLRPLTPYAVSKARTEEALASLADAHFSPIFLRNATVYGVSPRLRADLVLNNLTAWAVTTGQIRMMSDGTPWRPIVHVEDVAHAFAAALTAHHDLIHNQAFNVGVDQENYRVRDLAQIVQETVPGCTVEYAGQGGPDPRNYRVDFGKLARTLTAFRPQWNARLGAEELAAAYRRFGLTVEAFQGRRFTRLAQIQYLLETGALDETLRWKQTGQQPRRRAA